MRIEILKDPKWIKEVIEMIMEKNGSDALEKELQELGPDFDISQLNVSSDTIISQLIELKKYNFLDFVEEVKKIGLCTRYFCTTCGATHYRAVLQYLGEENMKKLLLNVTAKDLQKYDIHFWLHPFMLLMNDMPRLYFEDILIVKEYRRSRNAYEEKRSRVIVEKEEDIQKRKKARLEQKKRNAQKHNDYVAARNQDLIEFKALPTLNEKLLYILADKSRHPLYFGLDFNAIKDDELKSLPAETLNNLYEVFSQIPHKQIQEFNNRLRSFCKL